MSRVGELQGPDAGAGRLCGGLLAGAAALLGLGHLFSPRRVDLIEPAPPSAGELPRAARGQLRGEAASEPETSADEAERLVAHIVAQGHAGRARRILLTHADSPDAALDDSGFAARFARSLSFEGRTILVLFGAGNEGRPGLSELIDGSASFSEAIHRETGSRLHVLPAGRGRAAPGSGLNVVLDALSDTYDFVVLAAAAEEGEALRRLALALAPRADHALIGCAGQTGSPEMVALRDALKNEGAGEVVAARIGQPPADSREAA